MTLTLDLSPEILDRLTQGAIASGVSVEDCAAQVLKVSAPGIAVTNVSLPPEALKVYYKGHVLVVEPAGADDLDINQFIEDLREERIQEQMEFGRTLFDVDSIALSACTIDNPFCAIKG
jgi:hypothetical protein